MAFAFNQLLSLPLSSTTRASYQASGRNSEQLRLNFKPIEGQKAKAKKYLLRKLLNVTKIVKSC